MPQISPILWILIIFILIVTLFTTSNSINTISSHGTKNANSHSFNKKNWLW